MVALERWREDALERGTYRFEKQERELVAERARREACKTREAETVSANWYATIDSRIHEHLKSWLWKAIDERVTRWWNDNAIDERIAQSWDIKCEPLKDGIGGALGTIRERLRAEFKHGIEEAVDAFGGEIAALEQRLVSNHQAALASRIEAALAHERAEAQTRLAALEERLKTTPGKLPVAKIWCPESVTYQAEFVCHEGALWQACTDTAQAPGGSDWVCVARAGRDAVTPSVRGTYDAHKTYARLDIVEYDGAGYLARRDAPGVPGIPGEGWQLMSRSGRRGATGETGPRGRKGEKGEKGDAPEIVSWHLERKTYRAFPVLADGRMGPELNLRPLFEQFVEETGRAAE
jgi:hypothetical protein